MTITAASYPLADAIWTMFVFFAWVIWFWLLITIFADLFRRSDVSGWGKAGWTVLVLFLPLIGVLIYLISQGGAMTTRRVEEAEAAQQGFDSYVRSVASEGQAPTTQISQAKQLLDSGAITDEEFEAIKRKALAG